MTIENGDGEKIPWIAGGCLRQDGPEEAYILGYGRVFRFSRRRKKVPGVKMFQSRIPTEWVLGPVLDQFQYSRLWSSCFRDQANTPPCFLYISGQYVAGIYKISNRITMKSVHVRNKCGRVGEWNGNVRLLQASVDVDRYGWEWSGVTGDGAVSLKLLLRWKDLYPLVRLKSVCQTSRGLESDRNSGIE